MTAPYDKDGIPGVSRRSSDGGIPSSQRMFSTLWRCALKALISASKRDLSRYLKALNVLLVLLAFARALYFLSVQVFQLRADIQQRRLDANHYMIHRSLPSKQEEDTTEQQEDHNEDNATVN
eukprot:g61281.t1